MPSAVGITPKQRVWLAGIILILAAVLIGVTSPGSAQAARSNCGTFKIVKSDHIKRVHFPAGTYKVTAKTINCVRSIKLLKVFLADKDMNLRPPWVVNKNLKFARGKGSKINFKLTPGGNNGGGGGKHVRCHATFRVVHNDRINSLAVPKGNYRVTLLQKSGITCTQTTAYMQRFLAAAGNRLPKPWILHESVPSFIKGKGGPGFKIKKVS